MSQDPKPVTLSKPRVGSRRWLLGAKLDPLDPRTRHSVVLIAFLAWIGLVGSPGTELEFAL